MKRFWRNLNVMITNFFGYYKAPPRLKSCPLLPGQCYLSIEFIVLCESLVYQTMNLLVEIILMGTEQVWPCKPVSAELAYISSLHIILLLIDPSIAENENQSPACRILVGIHTGDIRENGRVRDVVSGLLLDGSRKYIQRFHRQSAS